MVRRMKSTSVLSIHGPAMANTSTAEMSLGTKASVASCTWVTAWKTLTARPTASTTPSTGMEIMSSKVSASRPKVSTYWEVMEGFPKKERG